MIKKIKKNVGGMKKNFGIPSTPRVEGRDFVLKPTNKGSNFKNANKASKSSLMDKNDVRELMKFGLAVAQSGLRNKVSNNYFKLAEAGISLLGSQIPIVHNNRYYKKKQGTVKSSVIHLGVPPTGKYAQLPSFHMRNSVTLLDTHTDCTQPSRKKYTVTKGGFNQRLVDIFDEDSYITVNDMRILTDCETEINKVKTFKKKKAMQLKEGKIRSPYAVRATNTSLYAMVHKIRSRVTINTDMPCYNTSAIIHICTLKDLSSDCIIGPNTIKNHIIEETLDFNFLQTSLRPDQILKRPTEEQSKEFDFKQTMVLGIDAILMKSTVFRSNINVVQTLVRTLKTGDRIELDINQHFKRGINLNLLNNIKDGELPATSFLIIEYIGDPRAQVMDRSNGLYYNGYSPVKVRYDYRLDVEYTCSEKNTDKPVVLKREEKHIDFDQLQLGMQFYPDRSSKFNLDYNSIQLGGRNTEGRYELVLDNENELVPLLSNLEKINELDLKKTLTEDDINLNSTVEDEDGLEETIKEALSKTSKESTYNDHEGDNEGDFWADKYRSITENIDEFMQNLEDDETLDLDE